MLGQQHTIATLCLEAFPSLRALEPGHLRLFVATLRSKQLRQGEVAYQQGWECPAYVMCVEGKTRVFKTSDGGRELLLYRVGAGETCVLTTACLLARKTFPAESIAEADSILAALPAAHFHELMGSSSEFRRFVFGAYGELIGELIALVDDVAFAGVHLRLAKYLLSEADGSGMIARTHQELADDLGSVREVVSRHIREWERAGWVCTGRGLIRLENRAALTNLVLSRAT